MKREFKLIKENKSREILDHGWYRWMNRDNYTEIDNYEFRDTFEFVKFEGYNSMNFTMKSLTNGLEYHMFLSEGARMFNEKQWQDGNKLSGLWTFRKQGPAISITRIGD